MNRLAEEECFAAFTCCRARTKAVVIWEVRNGSSPYVSLPRPHLMKREGESHDREERWEEGELPRISEQVHVWSEKLQELLVAVIIQSTRLVADRCANEAGKSCVE